MMVRHIRLDRRQFYLFEGLGINSHTPAEALPELGSIDRMGNKRLRCMLVEAVWHIHQWNQGLARNFRSSIIFWDLESNQSDCQKESHCGLCAAPGHRSVKNRNRSNLKMSA